MPNAAKKLHAALLVALVATSGCNDDPVDLGRDGPVGQLGASLTDYAGTWDGYAEAYTWRDGSDGVHLTLDAAGNGVLEIGDSAPLPPPEVDDGYPPMEDTDMGPDSRVPRGLFPGFSYPIDGAVVQSHRIRLGVFSQEIFSEWCELLPPVLDIHNTEEPMYGCLANTSYGGGEGGCVMGTEQTPIDCGKVLCRNACACDADSCFVEAERVNDVLLDAALEADGDELVGTLLVEERINIRMTRSN